jgi:carboxymethylenebutenolidase
MSSDWVNLAENFRAYTARPEKPSTAGVVILQEIFGVNGHIRGIVTNLGRMGYTTIAPELFHRQQPKFEVAYDEGGVRLGRKHKEACTAQTLLEDVRASMAWLREQGCTRIGSIGFCFGGHVAWLAGTLEGMNACACFYGGGIGKYRPGGGEPSVKLSPELKARMLMLYGEGDTSIPQDEVQQIAAALKQVGVKHEVFVFAGAGHGFACDERHAYMASAANMAWAETLKMLAEELKAAP